MVVRSFLLGTLTTLPLLATAWIAGRFGSEGPRGSSEACGCSEPLRLDTRALLDAIASLRSSTSRGSEPTSSDVGRESDAGLASHPSDEDAAAKIEAEIRRCFASYWRLSVDESDGVAKLVRDSGKSLLDDGVREVVLLARQRIADSGQRCESDLRGINARRPTMTITVKELEERSSPAAEAFHRQLDEFNEARSARVAVREKEKAETLAELAKALGAK